MATLTIETSAALSRETCAAIAKYISSLGSVDGHTLSVLLDGQTIAKSGRGRARASRSAPPASEKASKTSATSGLSGSGSYKSVALQSSLESKLRERLGLDGSTPWPLIWRAKATVSGRQYCQLARCRRRTKESASGLLPTPAAQSYGSNQGGAAGRVGKVRHSLESMARHNLWPTPTSCAPAKNGNNEAGNSAGLVAIRKRVIAEAEMGIRVWPTVTASDAKSGAMTPEAFAKRAAHPRGEKLANLLAGPLSPTFPAWLMGYPPEWLNCAPSETPSSRKSRQSSSKPSRSAAREARAA